MTQTPSSAKSSNQLSTRIKVALLFGGKSAEHEVSLNSARNVCEALDSTRFEAVLIGISKQGTWYHVTSPSLLKGLTNIVDSKITSGFELLSFGIKNNQSFFQVNSAKQNEVSPPTTLSIDVAFPILHGTLGEDGTIQGLFKMLNIPFVGCGVLGSSLCMDKDMMKRVFTYSGIPNAPYQLLTKKSEITYSQLVEKLGSPFFIKPANAGSSVGVHKIKQESDFLPKLVDAFKYDNKVIAEKFIKGREVEVSVLGHNQAPSASLPGEVFPTHEFYSYDAKYLDPNGASFKIPAELKPELQKKIQDLACKAYTAAACEGLSRVDFFITESDEVLINEINTLPGFTNISMYPKMWGATGLNYTDLITKLIALAFENFETESKIKTDFF